MVLLYICSMKVYVMIYAANSWYWQNSIKVGHFGLIIRVVINREKTEKHL